MRFQADPGRLKNFPISLPEADGGQPFPHSHPRRAPERHARHRAKSPRCQIEPQHQRRRARAPETRSPMLRSVAPAIGPQGLGIQGTVARLMTVEPEDRRR